MSGAKGLFFVYTSKIKLWEILLPYPYNKEGPFFKVKQAFFEKMNATNDAKILELAKSVMGMGNCWVCLWHLSRHGEKANFKEAQHG